MTQVQATKLMTDQEVCLYATDFRRAILGDAPSDRMCAAISAPMCSALGVLEVPVELVKSDFGAFNHVFLDLLDGRLLDPTADQFNWLNVCAFPAIYVGPPSSHSPTSKTIRRAALGQPFVRVQAAAAKFLRDRSGRDGQVDPENVAA
jgi:hypothetical protein